MTRHPAADWASTQGFSPEQIDCTTAVMLKILDGKCKMSADASQAVRAIYGVVQGQMGEKLGNEVHQLIADAGEHPSREQAEQIHRLRLHAEKVIPKPVMKRYKAKLAEAFQQMTS